jgi:hypothetical protein
MSAALVNSFFVEIVAPCCRDPCFNFQSLNGNLVCPIAYPRSPQFAFGFAQPPQLERRVRGCAGGEQLVVNSTAPSFSGAGSSCCDAGGRPAAVATNASSRICADNRSIAIPALKEFDEESRGGRLCRSTSYPNCRQRSMHPESPH